MTAANPHCDDLLEAALRRALKHFGLMRMPTETDQCRENQQNVEFTPEDRGKLSYEIHAFEPVERSQDIEKNPQPEFDQRGQYSQYGNQIQQVKQECDSDGRGRYEFPKSDQR